MKRLALEQVSGIRYQSSPWDLGNVTLHAPVVEIELPWRRWRLRREVGRRLRLYGVVAFTKESRHAWRWLGQKH